MERKKRKKWHNRKKAKKNDKFYKNGTMEREKERKERKEINE